jgi:hypothetical protein
MKRTFFAIMFLSIGIRLTAQVTVVNETALCDKWLLKNGWLDKTTIELERLDTTKHTSFGTLFYFNVVNPIGVYNVFEHHFSISIYNPQKLGMCGNGMLYIDKGEWSIKGRELTIDVKGGYRLESEFHYIIVYNVEMLEKDKMILTKKKIVKSSIKTHGT